MSLRELIKVAGRPNGPDANANHVLADSLVLWGDCGRELATLLGWCNGFYAYESALLVRGGGNVPPPRDLAAWNTPDAWLAQYDDFNLGPMLFFAEDVFGNQFAIASDRVVLFDPETGRMEKVAQTLEDWARVVLGDYAYFTGYPVAHEWQKRNGPLRPGTRLMPKIPFVCGGEFAVSNLGPIEEREGMAFRASLARQIKDMPDGAAIQFKIE
jgi:hypothetical protein